MSRTAKEAVIEASRSSPVLGRPGPRVGPTGLALALALALGPATPAARAAGDAPNAQGTWNGEIERLIADDLEHGRSWEILQFRQNGRARPLQLGDTSLFPSLEPGSARVTGTLTAAGITASFIEPLGSASACATTGEQKVAVLLFKLPSSPPQTATPESVRAEFFSTTEPSLSTYWLEASGGRTWISGDVFGSYTLDRDYTCDQHDDMLQAAIVKADNDTNLTDFSRIFLVFPRPEGCQWYGLAGTSCFSLTSPKNGVFSASVAWISVQASWGLPAHEGGHNLGLGHANTRQYSGQVLGAPGHAGDIQYMGDRASVLGDGLDSHYSARHKLRLGWLQMGTDILEVDGEGTFTLVPLASNSPGTKALRVRRAPGVDAWIWLEYRQPGVMFDQHLPATMYGGALMHYEDRFNGGPDLFDTNLLDSIPGSATNRWADLEDAPLTPGRRWPDPYGDLSVQVQSATPSDLTVSITRQASCLSVPEVARFHSAAQERGSLEITAQAGCAWAAATTASWIHLLPPIAGVGSATVVYDVDANPAPSPRSGEVTVGSRNAVVIQDNLESIVGDLDPAYGEGLKGSFRFKVTDPRGPQAVVSIRFWIEGGPREAFVESWGPDFTTAFLWETDTGTQYGPADLGSPGELAAKDFLLDLARSSVQIEGNDINVTLAISFSRAWPGTRTFQVQAWDAQGGSGIGATGSWAVANLDGVRRRLTRPGH